MPALDGLKNIPYLWVSYKTFDMKSFLKILLATILGCIISFVVVFFVGLGVGFAIIGGIASSADQPVVVKSNSILHLTLNETIADRSSKNPFEGISFPELRPVKKQGLNELLASIKNAKEDENIRGIFLDLTVIPAGSASLDEIRNALLDFKTSGKFIVSYADAYLQSTYYLASVSDSIFMNPAGSMAFIGLKAEVLFYKNMLDKLGVKPEIIRHGKFKSAVEPFMLDRMSDENKEQLSGFIGSVWNHLLDGISETRNIPVEKLNEAADLLQVNLASDAVNLGFIDGLLYRDQMQSMLDSLSGLNGKGKTPFISLQDYSRVPSKKAEKGLSKNKIAVVYATGDVIMGDGAEGDVGSERISKAIREARKDSTIKAIVLRINSPGGSALASEVIWREVKLAAEAKPLIASMGNVAASGGYYIACPADTIVAGPNTITGSIGVFGLLLNAQDLVGKKIGITRDAAITNKHSDLASPLRPMTPDERNFIQLGVEDIYKTFVQHVAEGRGMRPEQVDSIGQGRIWSGTDAVRIGLVDVLGGLDKAVEIAASSAGLADYRIISLPKLEDPWQQLMKDFSGSVEDKILTEYFGSEATQLKTLRSLFSREGIQARMPFTVTVY
jgi:protease-4